jgi:predicted dehydrogenase
MPLRIVQVGMGDFGRSWAAQVIPQVEDAELVACVDLDPVSLENARADGANPSRGFFLSLDEALDSTESDAVLVTATIAAHFPLIMAALAAGKHVLVEKPFVPALDQARLAVDTAAERGLALMVSQNYRFFPAVRAVQDLVAGGKLGEVSSVDVDFRKYDHRAERGDRLHYVMPQPLLVDMAVHHFDMMRAVLGREPKEIHCVSWNPPWSKYDDPPAAVATLKFEGDIVVSYRGSWVSPGPNTPWGGVWRMAFPEAEVYWTSRGGWLNPASEDSVTIRRLDKRARRMNLPKLSHLDRMGSLNAFIQAIRAGEEPETSGCRNIPTLALTLAAVDSAATGFPVLL